MGNKRFTNGLIILGVGLLASSVSSFLEHLAIFGMATDFIRGLFDGLAVVAFCVAIFILVQSRLQYKSEMYRDAKHKKPGFLSVSQVLQLAV